MRKPAFRSADLRERRLVHLGDVVPEPWTQSSGDRERLEKDVTELDTRFQRMIRQVERDKGVTFATQNGGRVEDNARLSSPRGQAIERQRESIRARLEGIRTRTFESRAKFEEERQEILREIDHLVSYAGFQVEQNQRLGTQEALTVEPEDRNDGTRRYWIPDDGTAFSLAYIRSPRLTDRPSMLVGTMNFSANTTGSRISGLVHMQRVTNGGRPYIILDADESFDGTFTVLQSNKSAVIDVMHRAERERVASDRSGDFDRDLEALRKEELGIHEDIRRIQAAGTTAPNFHRDITAARERLHALLDRAIAARERRVVFLLDQARMLTPGSTARTALDREVDQHRETLVDLLIRRIEYTQQRISADSGDDTAPFETQLTALRAKLQGILTDQQAADPTHGVSAAERRTTVASARALVTRFRTEYPDAATPAQLSRLDALLALYTRDGLLEEEKKEFQDLLAALKAAEDRVLAERAGAANPYGLRAVGGEVEGVGETHYHYQYELRVPRGSAEHLQVFLDGEPQALVCNTSAYYGVRVATVAGKPAYRFVIQRPDYSGSGPERVRISATSDLRDLRLNGASVLPPRPVRTVMTDAAATATTAALARGAAEQEAGFGFTPAELVNTQSGFLRLQISRLRNRQVEMRVSGVTSGPGFTALENQISQLEVRLLVALRNETAASIPVGRWRTFYRDVMMRAESPHAWTAGLADGENPVPVMFEYRLGDGERLERRILGEADTVMVLRYSGGEAFWRPLTSNYARARARHLERNHQMHLALRRLCASYTEEGRKTAADTLAPILAAVGDDADTLLQGLNEDPGATTTLAGQGFTVAWDGMAVTFRNNPR